MDNPSGTVVSLVDHGDSARAVVAVEVAAACPRCAAGKGCGAGLLTGTGGVRQVEAIISSGLDLADGDIVEISLAPDNLLRAAVIVYGIPMLGAAVGALVAFGGSLGDAAAAGAALLGLGCGLAISRWRLRQDSCLSQFVPTVERRI
jgi:positive regulator of sigma E activity